MWFKFCRERPKALEIGWRLWWWMRWTVLPALLAKPLRLMIAQLSWSGTQTSQQTSPPCQCCWLGCWFLWTWVSTTLAMCLKFSWCYSLLALWLLCPSMLTVLTHVLLSQACDSGQGSLLALCWLSCAAVSSWWSASPQRNGICVQSPKPSAPSWPIWRKIQGIWASQISVNSSQHMPPRFNRQLFARAIVRHPSCPTSLASAHLFGSSALSITHTSTLPICLCQVGWRKQNCFSWAIKEDMHSHLGGGFKDFLFSPSKIMERIQSDWQFSNGFNWLSCNSTAIIATASHRCGGLSSCCRRGSKLLCCMGDGLCIESRVACCSSVLLYELGHLVEKARSKGP